MKLYRITHLSGYIWHGTQADAKLGAKQIGGTWEQVDVPTDKESLLQWLNDNVAGTGEVHQEIDELHKAEQRAIDAARVIVDQKVPDEFEQRRGIAIARQQDTNALIDWLIEAQPWQIERVMEAIGTRLSELFQGG
jgi:hypothetical protein